MEDFLEQISIGPSNFSKVNIRELNAAKKHALNNRHIESCGLFCNFKGKVKFISCENLSSAPAVSFSIDVREIINFDVKYIFHSHINGYSEYPSSFDIKYSNELCIPFIIYSISRDSFFVYDNISV